jgi:hypothetical protein
MRAEAAHEVESLWAILLIRFKVLPEQIDIYTLRKRCR